MEHNSEAENRALDAKCGSERSMPTRIAVTKLKAMSLADKTLCLAKYAKLDLGYLVRCALAAGISADTRWGEHDEPVLCAAAEHGSSYALQALLAGGASLALADKNGWTAAHNAAFFGYAACLRLLLDAGAQLEAKTEKGITPLLFAAQQGRVEACQLLLLSGASVAAVDPQQETVLHLAARKGHASVIDMIAAAGAELDAQDIHGHTPLSVAASAGHVEVINALLSRGANANTRGNEFARNTVLMEAIIYPQADAVRPRPASRL